MTIEQQVFRKKRFDTSLLEDYGFVRRDSSFFLTRDFMDGDFTAEITVDDDGSVHGRVIDNMNGEEYAQLRMENYTGAYVGHVRESYREILEDISEICCSDPDERIMNERLIQTVLEIADSIPKGYVATYGQIAEMAGRPRNARLIGRIMSMADRYGDHPCHRVVNHAGRTVPGWKEQRALLEAEGVSFLPGGNVDMKKHRLK